MQATTVQEEQLDTYPSTSIMCTASVHAITDTCLGILLSTSIRLIDRIGLDKVEALENNNDTVKHDITYLRRIKRVFKAKLKLKKKLSLS